jgi:hypothetical protein
MNQTIEARRQIEQLIAGSPASLDELLRRRAQLGELEAPVSDVGLNANKKLATGPLTQTYQPTTPRK